MTDLTNRAVEEVQGFVQTYKPLLEISGIRTIEDAQILATILDISINHVKKNYNELSIDWKAWSVVVVKKLHEGKKFKYEEDITTTIDDFIIYWKTNYGDYCNNLAMFASDFDKDLGFIYKYIHEKIGS